MLLQLLGEQRTQERQVARAPSSWTRPRWTTKGVQRMAVLSRSILKSCAYCTPCTCELESDTAVSLVGGRWFIEPSAHQSRHLP